MIWPIGLILLLFLGRSMFGNTTARVGERLYQANCSGCHGVEGEGFRGLVPPLAGADYWQERREDLPCIITKGMEGEILVNGKSFNQPMAGIENLTISQVQSLINFMEKQWGDPNRKSSYQDIKDLLETCEQ